MIKKYLTYCQHHPHSVNNKHQIHAQFLWIQNFEVLHYTKCNEEVSVNLDFHLFSLLRSLSIHRYVSITSPLFLLLQQLIWNQMSFHRIHSIFFWVIVNIHWLASWWLKWGLIIFTLLDITNRNLSDLILVAELIFDEMVALIYHPQLRNDLEMFRVLEFDILKYSSI